MLRTRLLALVLAVAAGAGCSSRELIGSDQARKVKMPWFSGPIGGGGGSFSGTLTAGTALTLTGATSGTTGLSAAAVTTVSVTYSLPSGDGNAFSMLTTNGAHVLNWQTFQAGSGITLSRSGNTTTIASTGGGGGGGGSFTGGTVTSGISPNADNTLDLGTTGANWSSVWAYRITADDDIAIAPTTDSNILLNPTGAGVTSFGSQVTWGTAGSYSSGAPQMIACSGTTLFISGAAPATTSSNSRGVTILSPSGGSVSGNAGVINITTGNGNSGSGGSLVETMGNGGATGAGGSWTVNTGNGGATGAGGSWTVNTGNGGATSGDAGSITFNMGTVTSGADSSFDLQRNGSSIFKIDTANVPYFHGTTRTDGAGVGTLTNATSAGNPTEWLLINVNGSNRYIPCWSGGGG